MQTRITELLNIKYPIFQGGMAWVADGDFDFVISIGKTENWKDTLVKI